MFVYFQSLTNFEQIFNEFSMLLEHESIITSTSSLVRTAVAYSREDGGHCSREETWTKLCGFHEKTCVLSMFELPNRPGASEPTFSI